MNAVDVTLLTSDWEGSPGAVRESLACQTPVVSVPVGDVPNVLSGLPGCAVMTAIRLPWRDRFSPRWRPAAQVSCGPRRAFIAPANG